MFPVDQLSRFEVNNPSYRLLKPWWDVFTDYLAAAMLVIALLSGALQATQSNLVCLPAVDCKSELNHSMQFPETSSFCRKYNDSATMRTKMTVLIKLQDRRQYDFVEAECGQKAVHWFASYFPLIIFIQAIILVVVDNFWLKFPQTSSLVEHFVTLVSECHNSPGTCLALSNTFWGTNITEAKGTTFNEDIEQGFHGPDRQPLLPSSSFTDGVSSTPTQLINNNMSASLEVSEAIKAKTLYEKMRQFRLDVEGRQDSLTLRGIYVAQAIALVLLSLLILILNASFYGKLSKTVRCEIDDIVSGNYNYKCSNGVVPYYQVTILIVFVLIILYLPICVYICGWTFSNMKKDYYFQKAHTNSHQGQSESNQAKATKRVKEAKFRNYAFLLSDILPATGDLAFMLHLLDKYNKLLSLRFGVFLSEKNEKKLKDFILMNEWPLERLQMIAEDGGRTLKLTNICGIPKTVFEMEGLDTLILENCTLTGDDFDCADWSRLRGLRSLSLIRCRLTSIPAAIFEVTSLETLNLSQNSIKSIPLEISNLRDLHTLIIANNNVTEGMEHIIALENLRQLNLRENNSLELSQPLCPPKLMRLDVNLRMVEKMTEETRRALADIIVIDESIADEVSVIKYSPDRAPHIEKARKDSEKVYKMTSKPKGLAMIINISRYNSHFLSDRLGSQHDTDKLAQLFSEIGYQVKHIPQDSVSSVKMFEGELSRLLNDSGTCNSIILVIMAHGIDKGMYLASGELISVDTIIDTLQIDSLQGKPKLIFIQTCRGNRTDLGPRNPPSVKEEEPKVEALLTQPMEEEILNENRGNTTDAAPEAKATGYEESTLNVSLPSYSDVVIAYSTLQGFVSYRNLKHGSWFISSLVEVFSKYAWEEDLLSLLTYVNYEVSRKLTFQGYRQVPAPQSTLRKKLFFLPGYFEDDQQ